MATATAKFSLPEWIQSIRFGDGCGKEHKPDKDGVVSCADCAAVAPNHTFHNPEVPAELFGPEAEWPANATTQLSHTPSSPVADSPRPRNFVERAETTVEELEAEIERLKAQVAAKKDVGVAAVADVGGGGSQSTVSGGGSRVAPAVRAHAESLGVDLETVTGTGKGGAVTKKDVDAAAVAKEEA